MQEFDRIRRIEFPQGASEVDHRSRAERSAYAPRRRAISANYVDRLEAFVEFGCRNGTEYNNLPVQDPSEVAALGALVLASGHGLRGAGGRGLGLAAKAS